MTLTVTDVASHIRRRLDGEPSIPVTTLINWAGRHLFAMHDWNFTVGRSVTLGTYAGQSLIRLPSDFSRFIAFEPSGTFTASFLTSHSQLLALRTSTVTVQGLSYWCALTFQSDVETNAQVPYLDVYPTPSETDTDVFVMYYQSGWVDVAKDSESLALPPFMELLFLEVVFAVAQAYDEHDLGMLSERVTLIQASALFAAAVHEDGARQDELGPLENTVGGGGYVPSGVWPTIIGGPS